MVVAALLLGTIGIKYAIDSFKEIGPETLYRNNKVVISSTALEQVSSETIHSLLEEKRPESGAVNPTPKSIQLSLTHSAQIKLDLAYEQLYSKQMKQGDRPYIDQISNILEVTHLPWSLQMAQLQKELETLDPTLHESISPDDAIGFLQITQIGYADVVQGYENDFWNTRESCTKLGLEVTKTWDELLNQWETNSTNSGLEVYLLNCGAVLEGINRYRIKKRFNDSNMEKDTIDNLQILAHILGFAGTVRVYEHANRSSDLTKLCKAARDIGKPISASYLETIKQYQGPWKEIETKYGPLNSESLNQIRP